MSGIWFPALGSDLTRGRWIIADLLMISFEGTANSNSKALMRVNNKVFALE